MYRVAVTFIVELL